MVHLPPQGRPRRQLRNSLLRQQGDACAICSRKDFPSGPCLDHNHTTGEVRGVLCVRCNVIVGSLESDIAPLAAIYLKEHGEATPVSPGPRPPILSWSLSERENRAWWRRLTAKELEG